MRSVPTAHFALMRLYTRREIADALGGGLEDYLPHRDKRVVCACVVPHLNPYAPAVILAGKGQGIVKWGKVFSGQREFVSVVLKRAPNAWQYVGRYRVQERSEDTEQITRWKAVSGRGSRTIDHR
jgi:hypothetical protein